MSTIKRTIRDRGLTTVDGTLAGTPGPLPITYAAPLGSNALGTDATSAMFYLRKLATDNRPCRYVSIVAIPTGVAAATVAGIFALEVWDPDAAAWCYTAGMLVSGSTPFLAAIAAKETDVGNALHVQIPRQATLGRVYVSGLVAAQGITFTIHADNDD